jgi:hypothetical protein
MLSTLRWHPRTPDIITLVFMSIHIPEKTDGNVLL